MGKRFENWLSKTQSPSTLRNWKHRWGVFVDWAISTTNPLTEKPYMECATDAVDDVIRADYESMEKRFFEEKYKDILTKYATHLKKQDMPDNSVLGLVSGVRSFFRNECCAINLDESVVPQAEMAKNEHRFTLDELRQMWLVADREGKARLSCAVSLGWSVKEFRTLKTAFMKKVLQNLDDNDFACFDAQRGKTKARVRAILNPCAISDLRNYLKSVPDDQAFLWTARTAPGFNNWIKTLYKEAGFQQNGTIRFHLIRKYVYSITASHCGPFEAKLLIGKKIPIADATYLQNLQDELLRKYKQFAYPFLKLDDRGGADIEAIEQHVRKEINGRTQGLQELVNGLATENLSVKNQLKVLQDDYKGLKDAYRDFAAQMGEFQKGYEEIESQLEHQVEEKLSGSHYDFLQKEILDLSLRLEEVEGKLADERATTKALLEMLDKK